MLLPFCWLNSASRFSNASSSLPVRAWTRTVTGVRAWGLPDGCGAAEPAQAVATTEARIVLLARSQARRVAGGGANDLGVAGPAAAASPTGLIVVAIDPSLPTAIPWRRMRRPSGRLLPEYSPQPAASNRIGAGIHRDSGRRGQPCQDER